MGKSDIILKNWLRHPARFADLFNHFLFSGETVISAEELTDIDREKTEYSLRPRETNPHSS